RPQIPRAGAGRVDLEGGGEGAAAVRASHQRIIRCHALVLESDSKNLRNARNSREIRESLEIVARLVFAATNYPHATYVHTALLTLNQRVEGSSPSGGIAVSNPHDPSKLLPHSTLRQGVPACSSGSSHQHPPISLRKIPRRATQGATGPPDS